jgi:hypothetical protein
MIENSKSQFSIETRVLGDEVRLAVNLNGKSFGTVVANEQTICWVPEKQQESNETQKMTWVMPWKQFADAMQTEELSEVVRLSESSYSSASRAGASAARPETDAKLQTPDTRAPLGLRRHFRKGYTPVYDDKWVMYYDVAQHELRMYRTWTGHCIFGLTFQEAPDGAEIADSWVNRDLQQYNGTGTKHDIEVASWLIDFFLLGKNREFPSE